MERKIKVKLKEHKHLYIHNDLANAAYYFKGRLEERQKNNDHEGVSLEMMACLTMIAFTIEARINFLGWKLIENWDERSPYLKKVEAVVGHLGLTYDDKIRPYKTIRELKDFRDTLAHGKPIELFNEQEIITTQDELEKRGYLTADWQKLLRPDFIKDAYDDMNGIWNDLLKRAKLEVFDTLSGGGSSVTFIEHVDEG